MRRRPWLTAATLAVTVAVNLGQLTAPDTLMRLERTVAVRHGEAWRLVTALLVQDGAALGAGINLLGLVVLGVIAEQAVSRPWWLAAYLVPGLAGEVAGVWWQPTGGGNSVAVCGLAAVGAAAVWRDRPPGGPPTRLTAIATLVWVALMLTSEWEGVFVPGVVLAVVAGMLLRGRAAVVVPAATAAGALALTGVGNIHGVALLAGLVLASALVATGRLPVGTQAPSVHRFWQAERHE